MAQLLVDAATDRHRAPATIVNAVQHNAAMTISVLLPATGTPGHGAGQESAWGHRKRTEHSFADLDQVTVSEVLRELEQLTT